MPFRFTKTISVEQAEFQAGDVIAGDEIALHYREHLLLRGELVEVTGGKPSKVKATQPKADETESDPPSQSMVAAAAGQPKK